MWRYTLLLVLMLLPGLTFSQVVVSGGVSISGGVTIGPTVCTLTNPSLGNAFLGVPYSSSAITTSGCTPPFTYSVQGGSLPNGLSISGTTGAISGTPTIIGKFTFTIKGVDSAVPANTVFTAPLTITVGCPPLQITTVALNPATVNVAYNQTIQTQGAVGTLVFSATGLPAGESIANTGVISGTPTAVGSFPVSVTLVDSCPAGARTVTRNYTETVNPATLAITTTSVPSVVVGNSVNTTFSASGGVPPYQWTSPAATRPAGTVDILDYALMPLPTRSTTQLSSGGFYKAFRLNSSMFWWLKGSAGNPWDMELYDGTYVYHWTTEDTDAADQAACIAAGYASCSADPNAYKKFVAPVPLMPRYFNATSPATANTDDVAANTWTAGGTGWKAVCILGNCPGGGTPGGTGTPSATSQAFDAVVQLDGQSTKFSSTSSQARANALWTYIDSNNDGLTSLTNDFQVYLTNAAQLGQFEFDAFVFSTALNRNFMFGWQCDYVDNAKFQVWNQGSGLWVSTPLACTSSTLSFNAWHHIVTQVHRITGDTGCNGGPCLYYDSITIDGTTTSINMVEPSSTLTPGFTAVTGHQFQVNFGPTAGGTITANVDQSGLSGNTDVTLTSTGSNPFTRTTNCGVDNQPPISLGPIQTVTHFDGNDAWGGSVGTVPTVLVSYYYSGTAPNYINRERYWLAKGFGQVQWDHSTLNGGVYTVDVGPRTTVNNVSGTTPTPNFACKVPQPPTSLLPPGATKTSAPQLDISDAGIESGTPTVPGTYTFPVQVEDSTGATALATFTQAVACTPLSIPTTSLPQATVGQSYQFQMTSTGGYGATTWTGTNLPGGLSISASGLISGTPTTNGTVTFSVTVKDSCPTQQTASASLSLVVNPAVGPPVITTTSPLPGGTVGVLYNVQMAATGGISPYVWSTPGGLPPGLTFSSTGVLSGTPTTVGTSTPTLTVKDANNRTASGAFSITIASSSCGTFSITSTSPLPNATKGQPYSFQFDSCGSASVTTGWNGILDPTRATDWTTAGVTNGIPSRTTPCATLNPGATAAQIITAIANCTPGQFVRLSAGSYTNMASWHITTSGVTLRGDGADLTKIFFTDTGTGSCGGWSNSPSICIDNNTACGAQSLTNCVNNGNSTFTIPGAPANSQGVTTVTFTGTVPPVGQIIVLDQADDLLSGGYPTNNDIIICASTSCTAEGGDNFSRSGRSQRQIVTVTGVVGQSVTFSPGLRAPNWRGTGGAYWSTATQISGFGLENMSIDLSGDTSGNPGIIFTDATNSWIKGVRSVVRQGSCSSCNQFQHVMLLDITSHLTVRDSYFYGQPSTGGGTTQYGIAPAGTSDSLIENNIVEAVSSPILSSGSESGDVLGYNYGANTIFDPTFQNHEAGQMFNLREGNDGSGAYIDDIHGTGAMNTWYRNHFFPDNQSGAQTDAFTIDTLQRFHNIVGNVLGSNYGSCPTPGAPWCTYQQDQLAQTGNEVFSTGFQNGTCTVGPNCPAPDARVAVTLMRWGNWDNITSTNPTGTNDTTGSRFNSNEVPSTLTNYANPVPGSQTLTTSFYLSARPPFWSSPYGNPPFPPIGPDVSNGNINTTLTPTGGHAWKIPSRLCWENAALDPAYSTTPRVRTFSASACYGSSTAPNGPVTWSGAGIPAGLTLSTGGLLSGTPTVSGGPFTLNITATDAASHTATGAFSLTILVPITPLQIDTTSPLPKATVGQSYNVQMAASGGVTPYAWSSNNAFPTGISMNSAGIISGMPTQAQSTSPVITVTDAQPKTATATFSLVSACPTFTISTTSLSPATVGQTYSFQMAAAGGILPLTWHPTPLPSGLTMSSGGLLSGTPTTSGSFPITFTVDDSCVPVSSASATLTLQINPQTLAITTTSPLPNGTVNAAYSVTLSGVGGVLPYTWSVLTGSLPFGLTLNGSTGSISGTPTTAQTANFTIQLADNAAHTATAAFTLTIAVATGADNTYCGPGNTSLFAASDGPANLPQTCIYTARSGTPSPGAVTVVPSGGSLQSALNNANCGDTIQLTAGSTYVSNGAIVPNKPCDDNHWITVTTTGFASLPAEGTRITPCYAGLASLPGRPAYSCPTPQNVMAKITTQFNFGPAIDFAAGANHYRFIGLEFTRTTGAGGANGIVYSLADLETANKIIFDQTWFHGDDAAQFGDETKTAVFLDLSSNVGVIDSYINDIYCMSGIGACTDALGISGACGGTPGTVGGTTYKIVDNYLEASGENFFQGGCPPSATFSDYEVRRNYLFKPLTWNPNDPTYNGGFRGTGCPSAGCQVIVKNLLETKQMHRGLFEGNILENSWGGFTQVGAGLLFNPGGDALGGANHDSADNITFRYNIIHKVGQAFQIANVTFDPLCNPCRSFGSKNISVHDVVVDHIGWSRCGSGCSAYYNELLISSDAPATMTTHDLIINHVTQVWDNTIGVSQWLMTGPPLGSPGQMNNFTLKNSIMPSGDYGILPNDSSSCAPPGTTPGTPIIAACWGGAVVFGNNMIPGGTNTASGTVWNSLGTGGPLKLIADQNAVLYVNQAAGDYHLQATSPGHNAADDGTDIGANIDLVNQYTGGGTVTPPPPPTITTTAVPNGAVSSAFTFTFTATGGVTPYTWSQPAGTLPNGLTLSSAGVLSGTPSQGGNFTYTIKVTDANTQAGTAVFTQTITSGGSGGLPWVLVSTPSGAPQIHDLAIIPANNHWFIADRTSGFWTSTNQGSSWTQINNSGIPACGWTITWDSNHSQLIAGTQGSGGGCTVSNANTYWRSSNEGTTWTQITLPAQIAATGDSPAYSGPVIGPSGIIAEGGHWSPANFGCGAFYSTDGGATTNNINYTLLPNASGNGCAGAWSFFYNPVTADFWMGTEVFGVLRSTDAINWTEVSPPNCESGYASPCLHNDGNIFGLSYDTSGNVIMAGQQMYKSSGSGGSYTWTLISTRPSGGGDIRTLYRDPNGNLYFGFGRNGSADTTAVYRSTDQGVTWSAWTSGIPPSSQGLNLETWRIVTNTTDHKLYANVQDGATNAGYIYATSTAIY